MSYTNSLQSANIFKNIPPISDYQTRRAWEEAVWTIISKQLSNSSGKLVHLALSLLLSPTERERVVYRAATINRLMNGGGSRAVGRELFLTRQTISSIKKALAEGTFQSSYKRGHKKRMYTKTAITSAGRSREYFPYRRLK